MKKKSLQRVSMAAAFVTLVTALISCGNDFEETPKIILNIKNGQFDLQAVLTDSNNTNPQFQGSGSLSFSYSGDDSGAFKVSGSLQSNQSGKEGVGALIGPLEAIDVKGEGCSMLGFYPTGNGKADVFLLGTRNDVTPIAHIGTGNYSIGPYGHFTGIYFIGIDINKFWAGDSDLVAASGKTYVISQGILSIGVRDGLHIVGSFSGTADLQVHVSKTSTSPFAVNSQPLRPWAVPTLLDGQNCCTILAVLVN